MRAAGKFISALTVFSAGVQSRQNHFDAGNFILRMDVHRNPAPVVADGKRTVHVDIDFDLVAMTGQMFVHGIVQNLAHAMMQRALIRAADIHAGFFADSFETFKFSKLRRAVIAFDCACGNIFFFR